MFEKVNPSHPDKVADRIAGAIVDIANEVILPNPKHTAHIAAEVLIGHNKCFIVIETNIPLETWYCAGCESSIKDRVKKISGIEPYYTKLNMEYQDSHLDNAQSGKRAVCGDNGIFRGVPISNEEKQLTRFVKDLYKLYPTDGKYLINNEYITICQSNADTEDLKKIAPFAHINPLGDWSGGLRVDTGATNRKLGSDMGRGVTGGGLHGKDLTKPDVTLNILCHKYAQKYGKEVTACVSIGDEYVRLMANGMAGSKVPYQNCINEAQAYLNKYYDGSFERLAEWGLI